MASPKKYVSKIDGKTYAGKGAKIARKLDGLIDAHSKFDYYSGRGGQKPGSRKK
jgi:hypothetical protein